jgi:transposase-like protein
MGGDRVRPVRLPIRELAALILLPPRGPPRGFRFPPDIIVLAVHWYLRFGRSYRDVEELLAERGIEADHVRVHRWVQQFTPLLAAAARPCGHAVGDRWSGDETDVKIAGRWRYVYRAIDQFGQIIDVVVFPQWDATAAPRFLERALGTTKVAPVEVVTDRAATYPMVSRSCSRQRGAEPSNPPTTGPRPITAG